MKGIYRKIDLNIWTDEKVRRLSRPKPNAFDLWLYLLTAKESIIIPGVIPAGAGTIGDTLRWPSNGVTKAFREIEEQGLAVADWKAQLVWVPKAIHFNPPAAPNVIRSWSGGWKLVPECSLRGEVFDGLKAYVDPLHPGFGEAFKEVFLASFPEAFSQTITPKPSQKGIPPSLPPMPSGEGMPQRDGGIQRSSRAVEQDETAFSDPPDRISKISSSASSGGAGGNEKPAAAAAKKKARRPRTKKPVRVVKPPTPEPYPPDKHSPAPPLAPAPEPPVTLEPPACRDAWNAAVAGTPIPPWPSKSSPARLKKLEAINPTPEAWADALHRVTHNRFLRGEKPGKHHGSPVGVDWLLRNWATVGDYEADVPEQAAAPPPETCALCGSDGGGAGMGTVGGLRFCYARCLGALDRASIGPTELPAWVAKQRAAWVDPELPPPKAVRELEPGPKRAKRAKAAHTARMPREADYPDCGQCEGSSLGAKFNGVPLCDGCFTEAQEAPQ